MKYKPITAVWEITMGCNMRCKHCGSSCENALEGELSTEEALKLCKDLGELGFKWITLSGGEPTTRKDWDILAKGLNDNNIIPNMITNGWLINEEIADRAAAAGINTIAISIDGLKETHDYIRKEGSYDRIMNAFDILKSRNIRYAAITTVNNINLHELKALKQVLVDKGVSAWQLQLGLPMGNLAKNKSLTTMPSNIDDIIDFAYEAIKDDDIQIQLADCIGYFNKKEMEIRQKDEKTEGYFWQGCGAGKYSLGILHNGDILGCTSVRDRAFIEGNVLKTPIGEIWESPDAFIWNRKLTKEKLAGLCQKCIFGSRCLGGCGNTRLTFGGSVYAENKFCSYNVAISKAKEQFDRLTDKAAIVQKAKKFAENGAVQFAELLLAKLVNTPNEDAEVLSLYGYVSYMLGNYTTAKEINQRLLSLNPEDAYANKGMGLTIAKLGELEKGIQYLKKAITLCSEQFSDPYYDLAVVLSENNRYAEALEVLKEGIEKYPSLEQKSQKLLEFLNNRKVG